MSNLRVLGSLAARQRRAPRRSPRLAAALSGALAATFASGCPPAVPPSSTGGPPPSVAPPSSSSLPVQLFPQEGWQWCWAASAQMIVTYLGTPVTQCRQASDQLGQLCPCDFCNTQADSLCDQPGWPNFKALGYENSRTSQQALSWEQLQQQLCTGPGCKRTPVAFSWLYDGYSGHMMVAKGYFETPDGARIVEVLDPMAEEGPCIGAEKLIPYDAYVAVPGRHTHWDDFYDITPN